MQGTRRLLCIICMILILIFALIHLGVSISIIVKFRNYGDVFRPERGLASFNIVISVYGFLIGVFGLFAALTNKEILGTIVAFASIVLAFFALASLITALIINSKSLTYVSSRFSSYMNQYKANENSRDIINRIQTHYDCCGDNIWLDWSQVSLNATGSGTNSGSTTKATTSGSGGHASSTTGSSGDGSSTTKSSGDASSSIHSSGSTTASHSGKRDAGLRLYDNDNKATNKPLISSDVISNDVNFKLSPFQQAIRRRRQSQSGYGGIIGLPSSFNVTLPESCCTTDLSSTDNLNNLYCISNAKNNSNNIHINGCSKILGKHSGGQTLGLAVINSFLVVLALAAIPALIETNLDGNSSQDTFMDQSASQFQQQHSDGAYSAPGYQPGMEYYNQYPGY